MQPSALDMSKAFGHDILLKMMALVMLSSSGSTTTYMSGNNVCTGSTQSAWCDVNWGCLKGLFWAHYIQVWDLPEDAAAIYCIANTSSDLADISDASNWIEENVLILNPQQKDNTNVSHG